MFICSACNKDLPEREFYKKGTGRHSPRCKTCYKLQVKEWRKQNPEKVRLLNRFYKQRNPNPEKRREAYRRYYAKNPEKFKQAVKRGRLLYPDRHLARTVLARWVRDGKLIRPKRCTVCGKEASRIEGHHPDYSLPLAVIWACKSCHEVLDKEAGR